VVALGLLDACKRSHETMVVVFPMPCEMDGCDWDY
jgi:hypothetical protein